ncbi:MAG TPA: ATP-binding protein [Syntrophomonadaceae bacterium]|nr:ATP-binding protein [Syntrophomonadaceae bacterium]HQA08017.1 ATP-binding protein [Syntrophomonadaceae bacterium]HQE23809.1 ATP-binding protein [Syntrophomonadaceae bacterium]
MAFLEREQLLNVLIGYNPWWTTGRVPINLDKPIRRSAFYDISKKLLHKTLRRIVFLSGARRVGKTTLAYQCIADLLTKGVSHRNVLYVSFDHPLLKFFTISDVVTLFMETIAGNTEDDIFLFFDEIQYAQDWDTWLKTLYDQNPNYRIMVTGSASPLVEAKGIESGVGRWVTIKIPTLSFYEYLDFIQVQKPELPVNFDPATIHQLGAKEMTNLVVSLSGIQKYFQRYLLVGGFPELVLSDDMIYAQRILREDVADKVLKRDLTALFGTRNVMDLEKLFLYLCLHSGGIVNQETVSKELGISRPTVTNYLAILEQANLIYISQPVNIEGKKVLRGKPKVYVTDVALRNAVLMLDEKVLADPDEMGTIIETIAFKHIVSYYSNTWAKIGYYRDSKSDKEVDIVITLPQGQILIEIKHREDYSIGPAEAIVKLANRDDTISAIMVTKRPDDYGVVPFETDKPIIKIPAFAFMYLLGVIYGLS